MGLSGAWKAARTDPGAYVGAEKWGTGWNPVHAQRTGNMGRNIAPQGTLLEVPEEITDQAYWDQYGYTDEDVSSVIFGYGTQTGTADRPGLGQLDDRSDVSPNFPPAGEYPNGIPGGTYVRSLNHGADATNDAKALQPNGLQTGEPYKQAGAVSDSVTADPSQLLVQTSDVQRDRTRAGSQTPEGRANEFDQPIRSRIPGQRIPVYSGGERHADMEPRVQDVIVRPFYNRTAGTGPVEWLEPNEMYVSEPLQRQPSPDPYAGPEIQSTDSGFVDEDVLPYV